MREVLKTMEETWNPEDAITGTHTLPGRHPCPTCSLASSSYNLQRRAVCPEEDTGPRRGTGPGQLTPQPQAMSPSSRVLAHISPTHQKHLRMGTRAPWAVPWRRSEHPRTKAAWPALALHPELLASTCPSATFQ